MNLGHNQWFHPPNRLIFTHGTPRLPPSGSTGRRVCPPPARRDAAFAPLRLDGTPRLPPSGSTTGSALSPTPPQGGSDTGAPYAGLRYHSPLEGESQKPSRQAKADAVGGRTPSRKAAARAVEADPSRFVALRGYLFYPFVDNLRGRLGHWSGGVGTHVMVSRR